jgi:pimeloyl-ACP methyl ester carboxylesterase
MPAATVDGWEFSYAEAGSGPPVILLHGFLMDRSMWDRQIEALAGSYRVVTIDAPGHGESPGRPVGFTLPEEASVLAGLAAHLGIDRAIWGGHSMGAFKSLCLAIDRPEVVRGLILIDANAGTENPDMVPQYNAMVEVAKQDGISVDLATVAFTLLTTSAFVQTDEAQRWIKRITAMDANAADGTARAVFDRTSRMDEIGRITVPTLIVHGVEDFPNPIEIARAMRDAIQSSELVEIAGSGHTSPVEKPDEVARAIRAFCDRLPT